MQTANKLVSHLQTKVVCEHFRHSPLSGAAKDQQDQREVGPLIQVAGFPSTQLNTAQIYPNRKIEFGKTMLNRTSIPVRDECGARTGTNWCVMIEFTAKSPTSVGFSYVAGIAGIFESSLSSSA